jgi:hypothetical protein
MHISNFLLLVLGLIMATLAPTMQACQCLPRPENGNFVQDRDATRQ